MGQGASKDDVFDALANRHRRQMLLDLLEREWYPVSKLTGVSRELAGAHESLLRNQVHESLETVDVDEQLLRIHVVHLPKLEEYGFVDWEHNDRIVTRGQRFEQLRPHLEVLDDSRSEHGVRRGSEPVSQTDYCTDVPTQPPPGSRLRRK